jgi:hypothetical protein
MEVNLAFFSTQSKVNKNENWVDFGVPDPFGSIVSI